MKKKIVTLGLILALAATAVVGGTMAYFTDQDADANVFVVGNVKIVQNEEQRKLNADGTYDSSAVEGFKNNQNMVPAVITSEDGSYSYDGQITLGNGKNYKIWDASINNEIDKFITVTNTGTEEAYVRTILAFEDNAEGKLTPLLHTLWGGDEDGKYEELTAKPNDKGEYVNLPEGAAIVWLQKEDGNWLTVELGEEGNKTTCTVAVLTYKDILAPKETSEPSLMQVWLDPKATNEWSEAVGGQYNIYAASLAVQADGFDNATKAMDTAFDLTAENLVEWLSGDIDTADEKNVVPVFETESGSGEVTE